MAAPDPGPDPTPTKQDTSTVGSLPNVTASPPASGYARVDLVSDQAGVAPRTDADLVNAWGITTGEGGLWIADDVTGKVSIYDGDGAPAHGEYTSGAIDLGEGITGVARNDNAALFQLRTSQDCASGGSAEFIFASVHGQLIAVNTELDPTRGIVVVNEPAAVFTGVAIAGAHLLGSDLVGKRIAIYDSSFQVARDLSPDAFIDPNLPAEYGPFNVMTLGGHVFVAYAAVDAALGEEVHGAGLGIVSEFDLSGHFVRRIATVGDTLNAPWGIAIAPASFGVFGGDLLVGNFGDGKISVFELDGTPHGVLESALGVDIVVDGLWGLTFGDGDEAGDPNVLYFAAGPDDETHGLFGRIVAATCAH